MKPVFVTGSPEPQVRDGRIPEETPSMNDMNRGPIVAVLALMLSSAAPLLALHSPAALAQQAWPVKPVRMLIPWPPGGSNDVAGRIIVPRLSEALGQQVTIENRG
jgi:hypothetical protein